MIDNFLLWLRSAPNLRRARQAGRCSSLWFVLLWGLATGAGAAASPSRVYTLASGSAQGVYFPLAQDIAALAHKAGVEIRVLPSEGSKQNLGWLAEGRADLALTQSDAAWDAYKGRGIFSRPITSLRAIAPLYTEAVHILVQRPLYLHRLEDLRGKRIAIGPPGSGTEANAIQLLGAAGLTINEVSVRHMSVEDAMSALRRGELDAAFLTSGVPSAVVTGVLADRSATLFELDPDLLERLRSIFPFFLQRDIEQSDYPHLNEQVTTVGVQALLVGRSDLPAEVVDRLVTTLADNRALAKYHLPAPGTANVSDITIKLFPQSRQYYAHQELLYSLEWSAGILGALLILAPVAWRFREKVGRVFRQKEVLRIIGYFMFIWLTGSTILYEIEHRNNDNYSNLLKSMWSGLLTISSLSSKEPLTGKGRAVAVVMFILGLASIVWLGEKLLSVYVKNTIIPLFRGGFIRMHKAKDHYVIVGWSNKAPGIIEQLHSDDMTDKKMIFILADKDHAPDFPHDTSIHVHNGRGTNVHDLTRVNVQTAHSVILLAEGPVDSVADAKTIQTILAIRRTYKDRPIPVIAEIIDPQSVELAKFAGGPEVRLEVISSHKVGEGLLTQAAVNPGLSSLYNKLLTFGKNNSEIHRAAVPKELVLANWSFDRLASWSLAQRANKLHVIPIAIQRGSEVHVNPLGKLGQLEENDFLFAICDSPRDLDKLYSACSAG